MVPHAIPAPCRSPTARYARLPSSFEASRGQADARAALLAVARPRHGPDRAEAVLGLRAPQASPAAVAPAGRDVVDLFRVPQLDALRMEPAGLDMRTDR